MHSPRKHIYLEGSIVRQSWMEAEVHKILILSFLLFSRGWYFGSHLGRCGCGWGWGYAHGNPLPLLDYTVQPKHLSCHRNLYTLAIGKCPEWCDIRLCFTFGSASDLVKCDLVKSASDITSHRYLCLKIKGSPTWLPIFIAPTAARLPPHPLSTFHLNTYGTVQQFVTLVSTK